jgi:hypothetical protein
VFTKKSNKLIILGNHPMWVTTPFADASFEIWAMNNMWEKFAEKRMGRADVWWELHKLETRTAEQREWLRHVEIPVVMQKRYPEISASVEYPLDRIIREYGRRYFLCTTNYQIALAMLMGYTEIHMHGFNMAFTDNLIQRRPTEYWLGRAEQKGIKIYLPDYCDLLQSPYLYGYEADNTLTVSMSKYLKDLEQEVATCIDESIVKLNRARESFKLASTERIGFIKGVFERHGLNSDRRDGLTE